MSYIDFREIQKLKPSAFKLYVYMLHRAEQEGILGFAISLAELAKSSGLQSEKEGHGNNGRVRYALQELEKNGYVEIDPGAGRRPSSYFLPKLAEKMKGGDRERLRGNSASWELAGLPVAVSGRLERA